MKEIADAIADHIRETFPTLSTDMIKFTARNGWVISCYETFRAGHRRWECVRVEVFPDHVELWLPPGPGPGNVRTPQILSWELPDLFDIVDDALGGLCEK